MKNDDFMDFVGYQLYGGGDGGGSNNNNSGGGGSGCFSQLLFYGIIFVVICYILGSCGA